MITFFVNDTLCLFSFYVVGNIERSEAESMVQYTEDVFFKGTKPLSQPLFPSQHLTNRVVKLEKGTKYLYTAQGLNPNDENSALVHYIQVNIFYQKRLLLPFSINSAKSGYSIILPSG